MSEFVQTPPSPDVRHRNLYTSRPMPVSSELVAFLRDECQLDCQALEVGGGGDCLFYAVGASLELMAQDDAGHGNLARTVLQQHMNASSKRRIVEKLRALTAEGIENMPHEQLLNMLLHAVQRQSQCVG